MISTIIQLGTPAKRHQQLLSISEILGFCHGVWKKCKWQNFFIILILKILKSDEKHITPPTPSKSKIYEFLKLDLFII